VREIEIDRGDRVLRVRDAGDPDGEGHFGIMEHPGEMLDALTGPEPAS
jgi:hypothetical protein